MEMSEEEKYEVWDHWMQHMLRNLVGPAGFDWWKNLEQAHHEALFKAMYKFGEVYASEMLDLTKEPQESGVSLQKKWSAGTNRITKERPALWFEN